MFFTGVRFYVLTLLVSITFLGFFGATAQAQCPDPMKFEELIGCLQGKITNQNKNLYVKSLMIVVGKQKAKDVRKDEPFYYEPALGFSNLGDIDTDPHEPLCDTHEDHQTLFTQSAGAFHFNWCDHDDSAKVRMDGYYYAAGRLTWYEPLSSDLTCPDNNIPAPVKDAACPD